MRVRQQRGGKKNKNQVQVKDARVNERLSVMHLIELNKNNLLTRVFLPSLLVESHFRFFFFLSCCLSFSVPSSSAPSSLYSLCPRVLSLSLSSPFIQQDTLALSYSALFFLISLSMKSFAYSRKLLQMLCICFILIIKSIESHSLAKCNNTNGRTPCHSRYHFSFLSLSFISSPLYIFFFSLLFSFTLATLFPECTSVNQWWKCNPQCASFIQQEVNQCFVHFYLHTHNLAKCSFLYNYVEPLFT